MAFENFVDQRQVVDHRGRRFVCRPPTVEAVMRFMDLFGTEIRATVQAFKLAGTPEDPLEDILPIYVRKGDGRAASVLASCVSVAGLACDQVEQLLADDQRLTVSCAGAVLGLSDLRRVVTSLRLDKVVAASEAASDRDDDEGPTSLELSIVKCAQAMGCHDPAEVSRWSYERFLSACDAIALLQDEERAFRCALQGKELPRSLRHARRPRAPKPEDLLTTAHGLPGIDVFEA